MLPWTFEELLSFLVFLVIIAFVGYIIQYTIRKIMYSYNQRKKAAISVIARYRNKATLALWEDLMDIKLAGIVPVGTKVEGWLNAMFPREMAELENQRTKNPIAWRSTIEFLAPVVISIKHFATYKGQEVLKGIIGNVVEGLQNANNPVPEQNPSADAVQDQDCFPDLNQGQPGSGEL